MQSPKTPDGCNDYLILNNSTRKASFNDKSVRDCDKIGRYRTSQDWKGENWYRILPPAGTKIPETVTRINHCGTDSSGWINGTHPATVGLTEDATVCFNWNKNTCYWNSSIKIRNCGKYFLYNLPDTKLCSLRYCTV